VNFFYAINIVIDGKQKPEHYTTIFQQPTGRLLKTVNVRAFFIF